MKLRKMGLTSIINSTIAAAMIAASPVHSKEQIPEAIELQCPLDRLQEPNVELPVRDVKYMGYWLSKDEYESVVQRLNDGSLAKYETKQYLNFVSVMRYRDLIDFAVEYYGIDKDLMLRIMSQESEFNIRIVGNLKERGLGQFKKSTANRLVDRITDPSDELYYPFIDKGEYKFRNLSRDYRLNILLVAAKIKAMDSVFKSALEDASKTEEDLASRIEEYGRSTRFKQLGKGKSEKFNFYKISNKLRKSVNRFWQERAADSSDLIYLVYNGGSGAIKNMFSDNVVTEVLTYNFTVYSKRDYLADHFKALYEGGYGPVGDGMEDVEKVESEMLQESLDSHK